MLDDAGKECKWARRGDEQDRKREARQRPGEVSTLDIRRKRQYEVGRVVLSRGLHTRFVREVGEADRPAAEGTPVESRMMLQRNAHLEPP